MISLHPQVLFPWGLAHIAFTSLVIQQSEEHGKEPALWVDPAIEFCFTQHFLHIWGLLHQDQFLHILGVCSWPCPVFCVPSMATSTNICRSELGRTYMSWSSILSSSRMFLLVFCFVLFFVWNGHIVDNWVREKSPLLLEVHVIGPCAFLPQTACSTLFLLVSPSTSCRLQLAPGLKPLQTEPVLWLSE